MQQLSEIGTFCIKKKTVHEQCAVGNAVKNSFKF